MLRHVVYAISLGTSGFFALQNLDAHTAAMGPSSKGSIITISRIDEIIDLPPISQTLPYVGE